MSKAKFCLPEGHLGGWGFSSDTVSTSGTGLAALPSLYLGLLVNVVALISVLVHWVQLQLMLAGVKMIS